MHTKPLLRDEAIGLRKEGFTYAEILKQVPVAKSTLSLWLRSVGLAKRQEKRITQKKLASARKGGEAKQRQRILATEAIKRQAVAEIGTITERELWLIGTTLYWAEGSKAKEYSPSVGIIFSNSDPLMIKIFLKWLISSIKIPKNRICFEIFVHESRKSDLLAIVTFWRTVTGFPKAKFDKIYFKKNKISTKRRNVGAKYYGQLRVKVSRSTNLNRQISGWTEGICLHCPIV